MRLKFWQREKARRDGYHGTVAGYTNRGCRCDECLSAMREYKRAWEAKVRRQLNETGQLPPSVSHGTRNAYATYGCRCEACRDAEREYAAAQRMRSMVAK